MDETTIAAIGTPPGRGGIGVVRISGPKAIQIASRLFQYKSLPKPSNSASQEKPAYKKMSKGIQFKSRKLYYGTIIDPEDNTVIDEVLMTAMYAPYSYTREDVAEIQAHGGNLVLRKILKLVLEKGAVLARPGEFTRRAFINGRIDLTRAEGIIDLINAKTEKAALAAATIIEGSLQKKIDNIKNRLSDVLAQIEAMIDFPEMEGEFENNDGLSKRLKNDIGLQIEKLISRYEEGRLLREGLRVLLLGKPNVGKSSLMNALSEKERAIVTEIPGTTRDTIEETLSIDGFPVVFIDSAGIHKSCDPLEEISMSKTKETASKADLILYLVDVRQTQQADESYTTNIFSNKKTIMVLNKTDLVEKNFEAVIPKKLKALPKAYISAKYGTGLITLKEIILRQIKDIDNEGTDADIMPNLRQKMMLDRCQQKVSQSLSAIRNRLPSEIVAIEIKEALEALGEITGKISHEDVLDQIFSRFCVGK